MSNNIQHTLASVTESILEQVAFVFTDDTGPQCKPQSSHWNALGAELCYTGVKNGIVHVWLSTELASNIASNMLAIDGPIDAEKAHDAVKEICNIISGNFITSAFQNMDITLQIPSLLSLSQLTEDFNNPDGVWFSSEDGPILVLVKEP